MDDFNRQYTGKLNRRVDRIVIISKSLQYLVGRDKFSLKKGRGSNWFTQSGWKKLSLHIINLDE